MIDSETGTDWRDMATKSKYQIIIIIDSRYFIIQIICFRTRKELWDYSSRKEHRKIKSRNFYK